MESTKQLMSSGLNTTMMVAFGIPGGAPIGIGAAIGEFFLNLLYPSPPPPPPVPPVSHDDLEKALESLKKELIDILWKGQADPISYKMLALNTGFLEKWTDLSKLKMEDDRYVLTEELDPKSSFVNDTNAYFSVNDPNAASTLTVFRGWRNTLEGSSLNDDAGDPVLVAEHKTRMTGLYCLLASLTLAYLKAGVVWGWGMQRLYNWQQEQYDSKIADWNQKNLTVPHFAEKNPLSALQSQLKIQYPDASQNPSYVAPDWNAWLTHAGNPQVQLIVEATSILDFCLGTPAQDGKPAKDGLYTTLRKNWDDFDSQMASFDVHPYSQAGIPLRLCENDMRAAIRNGVKRAETAEKLGQLYAIRNVAEDDLIRFKNAIDLWRATLASVSFVTYTVKDGETLQSIAAAQKIYQDPMTAQMLLDTNSDQLKDPNVLPKGTILKLYDPKQIPYLDAAKKLEGV